jgi:hypothetical protein
MSQSFKKLFARLEKDPAYIKEALSVAKEINDGLADKHQGLIDELAHFISHITHEAINTDNAAVKDNLFFIANELNRIIDEARS